MELKSCFSISLAISWDVVRPLPSLLCTYMWTTTFRDDYSKPLLELETSSSFAPSTQIRPRIDFVISASDVRIAEVTRNNPYHFQDLCVWFCVHLIRRYMAMNCSAWIFMQTYYLDFSSPGPQMLILSNNILTAGIILKTNAFCLLCACDCRISTEMQMKR